MRKWALLFVLINFTGFRAAAAPSLDHQRCSASDPDVSIMGCTAMIQSGSEPQENLAKAFYNRGIAYDQTGQDDRAIEDFDQAIRLNPDYAKAFNTRGMAYFHKGEYDRAIHDFNEAIRLNPNDAEAFNNRGRAYAAEGQGERANQDFDQALRLNPKGLRLKVLPPAHAG